MKMSNELLRPTNVERVGDAAGSIALQPIVAVDCPGGYELGSANCCSMPQSCSRQPGNFIEPPAGAVLLPFELIPHPIPEQAPRFN